MAINKIGTLEREQAYREAFLARLNQQLAAPTAEWPTVRCWTKPALDRVFRQVRDELAAENVEFSLSHASLLKWLCRLRLAAQLPDVLQADARMFGHYGLFVNVCLLCAFAGSERSLMPGSLYETSVVALGRSLPAWTRVHVGDIVS